MSRLSALKVLLIGAFPIVLLQPAMAQDASLSQVDITQGIAEQSAMNAMRTGYVPPQAPLQGYANQTMVPQQAPAGNYQGGAQGYSGQNFNQQNFQGASNYNNGQNCNNNIAQQSCNNMTQQSSYQGNAQQQQCNGNNGFGNNSNNSGQHSGSTFGGVNKQMVGVVGAALLMNYAANGGMQNFMGSMRARGYNNRFRGFGPSIGH